MKITSFHPVIMSTKADERRNNMKKLSKWICFALLTCLLCSYTVFVYAEDETAETPALTEETAAEKENAETAPGDKAMWTVMIYLCGTDLESDGAMATANLEMISKTVPDSNVNVVIQTGGTKAWNAEEAAGIDIAEDKLQRWSYGKDGFTLVEELENASMAKHTTLSDFIRFGAENYPAEKNLLIVWDHGCGSARGLIMDELHDQAIMSVEGLERALKNGGVHFDLFMTDTCLMASIETAQAVAPYADYLLASEEVLPGLGSNYEEWLQDLYDEPECGPKRLGKNIVDATELMYAEQSYTGYLKGLTFSVIDLSKVDDVAEAFNDYLKEVVSLIPDPKAFGKYLEAVSTTDRYEETEMWDLYDMARRGLKGGISKEAVLNLENAVDEAVVADVRGAYHPYSHGMSAFISFNGDVGKLDRFARTCKNPWQMAFLDAVSLRWDAPEWAVEVAGEIPQLRPELYTVKYDIDIAEGTDRETLNIYSGIESGGDIRYELQRYDEQHEEWQTLGESEDVNLIEKKDDGSLAFAADFTGKWPAIKDQFLHVTTKDVTGHTVLMQASVLAPEFSEDRLKKLRILAEYPESMDYADEEGDDAAPSEEPEEHVVEYELEGLWDGYDSSTGLADRNTFSMEEIIGLDLLIAKPVFSDFYKKEADVRFYDPITVDLDLAVEEKVLPEGQYRLRYSITDMLGRKYNSEFVYITWDGEKAAFETSPEEEAEDADAADTADEEAAGTEAAEEADAAGAEDAAASADDIAGKVFQYSKYILRYLRGY